MKSIYKVKCNGTGYFTYWNRSTGKKRGTWDPYKPTKSDLSQLPKDFISTIRKCLDHNKKKYGRSIMSLACGIFEAGILCGWHPQYLKDFRLVLWHPKERGFAPFVAFQILNWRWRKVRPKGFPELLLTSPALLRFVVDTSGRTRLWSQKKRSFA